MKVGIACEHYKVERFKRDLTVAGSEFTVAPGKIATIVVNVEPNDLKAIEAICKKIQSETYRKDRN